MEWHLIKAKKKYGNKSPVTRKNVDILFLWDWKLQTAWVISFQNLVTVICCLVESIRCLEVPKPTASYRFLVSSKMHVRKCFSTAENGTKLGVIYGVNWIWHWGETMASCIYSVSMILALEKQTTFEINKNEIYQINVALITFLSRNLCYWKVKSISKFLVPIKGDLHLPN